MSSSTKPYGAAVDFDPDALRKKYDEERSKRLRPDGEDQYIEASDSLRYMIGDPQGDLQSSRSPIRDEVDVLIIGAGFGGLLAGARLREAGVQSLRIIDAGGDFGGTWYWNQYPGCQCDVDSYCYIPLLEETGYIPKEKYSYAPEIYEHSRRIAEMYNLRDGAIFQTKVTHLRWDETARRWAVSTDRDDSIHARFVVTCTGLLSRPKLPGIPGLESFKGHTFHTSRWDFSYTGGGHSGGMSKLRDKRVAFIGTGSTAVQAVPHLGADAQQLYVFQRTPTTIGPRRNKRTDPKWAKDLKPGWQRERRKNFNDINMGLQVERDLVDDPWTELFSSVAGIPAGGDAKGIQEAIKRVELADFQWMNRARAAIDEAVNDPAVAAALKPWYRVFCKRPTFNDDYLATFNRPNVKLIDTSPSKGVERVTASSVIANGVAYEVDCIIFSTGFEFNTPWVRRQGYDVEGKGGQLLSEAWSNGMKTLHGFTAHGFPNYFIMGNSQNGFSINYTAMIDDQAQHISYIIGEVMGRNLSRVEPTAEAETAWVTEIRTLSVGSAAFFESCTPGYYNAEGQIGQRPGLGFGGESYAPGINAFNALMADWREQGELTGLTLS